MGLGAPHGDFPDLPKGRVQELLLASSHACTVEPGEVAARLPMLQTCKADGLTAGSLVPTRLVTLAAVTGGLSSDAQRRAVDEGKVCSMCRVDFGQPAATSTRARVIVNGCCHSYCKRCLSDLFIEARGEEFFCRHSSCRNRLQLGFLRELVDRGTYEASERALDDNTAWAALDKSCPPPCELEGFRVSMCDSFIADAREGMLGRYAGTAQCEDGFDHVRILSKEFPRRPLAEADLIRPGSLDGIGDAAREKYAVGEGLQCSVCCEELQESQLAALPCGHSLFCRLCLERLRHFAVDPSCVRCPLCMAEHAEDEMHFCNLSCARMAFGLRLESLPSGERADSLCDGCLQVLPTASASIWRCRWPKRLQNGAAAREHFATERFHSKGCAEQWFAHSLQPLSASFGGNRQLYESGQNRRSNIDELTPLYRRDGTGWWRLGYQHARTEAMSLSRATEEWNDLLVNFPGMEPHAFMAHLDAAAGHWTSQFADAPKIKKLVELIADQEDSDKFLVFSQSKLLLERVADALHAQWADHRAIEVDERVIVSTAAGARGTVTGLAEQPWRDEAGREWVDQRVFVLLDGEEEAEEFPLDRVQAVPFFVWAKDGEAAMSLFRDEPTCCGLLLETGNFAAGLTLTAANTCFVLEPQLDAALQAQLEGRVHRPGQTRVAKIVHLYTPGTVEERVVQLRR